MEESEVKLEFAAQTWGAHPMGWPVPPRRMPTWWQSRRSLRLLQAVFGELCQADIDRFWVESRKGQSVYEDAGGGMLRCYRALVGLPTEESYTYQAALADLIGDRF